MPSALSLVLNERERQAELLRQGAIPFSCANAAVPAEKKLSVLVEEVGEVAKAIQDGKGLREDWCRWLRSPWRGWSR